MKLQEIVIFWFRRDLRLEDNAGLYHALKSGYPVLPVFIFDKNILSRFETPRNIQVEFICKQIEKLDVKLRQAGACFISEHATPEVFFERITERYNVRAVYANEDYELSAIRRDRKVMDLLKPAGIPLLLFKDQVIFAKNDILKKDGRPYTVFTPYSRAWKEKFIAYKITHYPTEELMGNLFKKECASPPPSLNELGYTLSGIVSPSINTAAEVILNYDKQRNYPAINGTTHLGVHLRFGTISIRKLVIRAAELSDQFLNQLIWREFYSAITWHFPHICEDHAFKRQYDNIEWLNDEEKFAAWCEGRTGYPIVDAGMRQLNQTGYMHNRIRMITASFLTKHLLTDWRWGEAYFANHLIDYDFSNNNGGWQWAAGSGCDAAPYFRIFNPSLQIKRFDPNYEYVKKWVPELGLDNYPAPIVEHTPSRLRAIEAYQRALNG